MLVMLRLSLRLAVAYERGMKEPPIFVIMKYAHVANVWIDVLVEDSLDLPSRISQLS
jgi:hypothetical protein